MKERKQQCIKKNAPFKYDFVGSFLRPDTLKKARIDYAEGKITSEDLIKVENEEITKLIAKQKEAGYHVITDGEFRRSYWHLDFMWGFNGIEHIELDHGYFFHGEETTHGSIAISDEINGENHPFVEHFKFVKQFEDDSTVARQTIPAPAQLYAELFREKMEKIPQNTILKMKNLFRTLPLHIEQLLQTSIMQAVNIQFDDCTWGNVL